MEQDLNEFNEPDMKIFKLEYNNQNVHNSPEFPKWLKYTNNYIKKENENGAHFNSTNLDYNFLLISFCKNCQGYTIFSFKNKFSCIKCSFGKKYFCIGCSWEEVSKISEGTFCLKGYLKLLYIRTINRRSDLTRTSILINITYIIFALFFTPLLLGCLSFILGFSAHTKKEYDFLYRYKSIYLLIYIFLRGLLMFPYIIFFFPFMFIMLVPAIFSKKYFYTIFIMYIASLYPGPYKLDNDKYN